MEGDVTYVKHKASHLLRLKNMKQKTRLNQGKTKLKPRLGETMVNYDTVT